MMLFVEAVLAIVLETMTDGEARDHAARCLQDRFGAPAIQAQRIIELVESRMAR